MESADFIRKIDELGRITLPYDIRKQAYWEAKDSVSVSYDEETGAIILKLDTEHTDNQCTLCGRAS